MSDHKDPAGGVDDEFRSTRLTSVPERSEAASSVGGYGYGADLGDEGGNLVREPGGKPEVAVARRESRLSYGFKLVDGRYRPPETEEEWNAFYQEYVVRCGFERVHC